MIMKPAFPMLVPALLLSACATKAPQPIQALAESRQCPAFPIPPAGLMQRPAKIDFLPPSPPPTR